MKGEQQKEFVEMFRKLLQGVYADRLLAYTDQKIIYRLRIVGVCLRF